MIVKFKNRIKATDKVHNATARKDIPLLEIAKLKVQSKIPDDKWLERMRELRLHTRVYSLRRIKLALEHISKNKLDLRTIPNGYYNILPSTLKRALESDAAYFKMMDHSSMIGCPPSSLSSCHD
ncbi:hypothetical protein SAMD00019534_036280 [Acytostelium subglobosum LB1]|uniref:hypothetical protein n=1 Tax=Acytostelium subglobosum LB1 TaxID=1410327 RepID=UPI00064505FA|nr:hypothetical protein SAMD00019534_036280 [Acytostelium subglobosum LB1]GAM20453.1 hypothetical protein SAMD00019534_036280 [Acytostelium subglobosum LB1]|eukprot:XP_012759974.1 hypothetical protein SAMD00019534_036280 [Acytostelium subglobosum LB1]